MKTENIKNITDRDSLSDLYSSLFINRDVFLKTDGINVKVNFIKFNDGKIYLDIPVENYEFKRSAIYTRNMEEVAYSHIMPFCMDNSYYVFETEGSQIFFAPRSEKRIPVDGKEGKKTVISQIISSFVIKESFMQNQARIDWLRHEIAAKLSTKFENTSVFFLGDRSTDTRMSWIMDDREPIYVPDIQNDPDTGEHITDSTSYLRDIYYHDPLLKECGFISEIAVPLLYRMMLPFGYIQVNDTGVLSEENFFMLKRLGLAYSESLSKDQQLFKPSIDTISISDLSMNGLGMTFREKSLARHFREDTLIIFTAYMPDNKNVSILCRIANINLNGNVYRVGCMIESMDTEGERHYRRFISGL